MSKSNGLLFDDDFLNKCRNVTKQYEKICGRWSYEAQLNHMHDETSEISDVLRNKDVRYGKENSKEYRAKLLDEIADYFLTGMPLLTMLDVSNVELNNAIAKKLELVKGRVAILSGKRKIH